jgi:hypothetical protein
MYAEPLDRIGTMLARLDNLTQRHRSVMLHARATGFSGKVIRTTLCRGVKHTITTTVSYLPTLHVLAAQLAARMLAKAPPELEVIDDGLAAMLGH